MNARPEDLEKSESHLEDPHLEARCSRSGAETSLGTQDVKTSIEVRMGTEDVLTHLA